jgi:uncharacterized protein (UPF0262 family)
MGADHAGDALVGEQCSKYGFHVVQTSSMDINALADSIAEIPGDKWAIQAVDYATGHSAAEKFKKAAEAAGKEVVLEQFAPLNTTDFGSYITKIKSSGAEAVFAVEYGADGVAFVQQANQFNLDGQLKSMLGFNMVSEPLFETLGDSVEGYHNNVGYDVDADNELNKEFVEAYMVGVANAGDDTITSINPDEVHEWRIAIYDLLETNRFAPARVNSTGPYALHVSIVGNSIVLDVRNPNTFQPIAAHYLSLTPFRRLIRDYFRIRESYYEAIRAAQPYQIETVDMARRGIHNEAAELLRTT